MQPPQQAHTQAPGLLPCAPPQPSWWLLDERCAVLRSSGSADTFLGRHPRLLSQRCGVLLLAADAAALPRLLARSGGSPAWLNLQRQGADGLWLQARRLQPGVWRLDLLDTAVSRLQAAPLQLIFGFTPAEADVAVDLAHGHRIEDVARRRGVQRNTAREQLKRAYAKAGVAGQSELVALIWRLQAARLLVAAAACTPD